MDDTGARPDASDTTLDSRAPDSGPKPLMRGWIHLATAPVALAVGIVLVVLAPTATTRAASAVFAVSAVALFTISAVYHRGTWTPQVRAVLRRLDHSAIALVIAGTYTPFSVLLLSGRTAGILLAVVWTGAIGGVLLRVLWFGAPRWLYTLVYVALGWAAVWVLPQFLDGGGPTVFALVVAGGVLYTTGAVAYALRRPDPLPRVFGYHEVFHAFTVAAFAAHAVGVGAALHLATA